MRAFEREADSLVEIDIQEDYSPVEVAGHRVIRTSGYAENGARPGLRQSYYREHASRLAVALRQSPCLGLGGAR